jgi:hypothetical protein
MKYKRDEINELLVDYIEGEASEGLKKDLDLVVKNSPIREKAFNALTETRKLVKNVEPKMADMSDAFFAKMHANIMDEVAKTAPQPRVLLWLSSSASWRSLAKNSPSLRTVGAAAVVVLLSGALFISLLRPSVKFESAGIEKQSDMLLSISLEVPEAFSDSLLNDRGDEFLMDAMAEKVAGLGEKDASNVITELGE